MRPFHIEQLPDDVLRLLFEQWLRWSTPKHICNLDSAFCNSSVRGWFVDFVRSRGIPLSCHMLDFRSVITRYDGFVRWLLMRRFPLNSIIVELDTASLRFLHSAAGNFSVLGSVRSVSISSCRAHDAMVAPNLLRALLTEASNATSLKLELGTFYDFKDSIPWEIVLGNRELRRLNVRLGRDSAPLLGLPRVIQQLPNIKGLTFNSVQFEWGEFDALLSSCPNLSSLSLENVEFRSVPSRDVLIAEQPSMLEFVTEITSPDYEEVAEYLLRRCPNVESAVLASGTFEWLPVMLQSSAVPRLRSFQIGKYPLEQHIQLNSTDEATILAESSEPFQFKELCGDGCPAIQLLRLLQSAQPEEFCLRAFTYKVGRAEFFRCHLSSPEFAALPLTHLHMAFEDDLGDVGEWLYMLRLPRLRHLHVTSELDYDFLDIEEGDLTDVLSDCIRCQRESGISPPPQLMAFTLGSIRLLDSVASQLVILMPCLTTLHLHQCPLDTQAVTTCIVGFPQLSMLVVLSAGRHAAVEFDFGDADFAGRPQLAMLATTDVLPTWAIVKSLVLGLGSHLECLDIERGSVYGGEVLMSQPDVEFLMQNRHVDVSDLVG